MPRGGLRVVVMGVTVPTALRQIRESLRHEHYKHASGKQSEGAITAVESRSFVRDALTTLVVVYGGKAMICIPSSLPHPYILVLVSFMLSSMMPLLCIVTQALIKSIPAPIIPIPSFHTEFPLLVFNVCNCAFLLCSIVPSVILSSPTAGTSRSPWMLLLQALANGGFFLINLFSFLHPTVLAVWTTTNLWCALLVTGLYTTLTHAQPFWVDMHAILVGFLGVAADVDGLVKIKPLDAEMVRAVCALVLAGLFITWTARTFGASFKNGVADKIKTN
ncbi:hypothetical protein F5141DRAFT_1274426 [Pisolithus sp. B1]|nr:hypothetical protein F5141DRAFT_1274426 [Pisolithus sp. B1]